jgi:hypothetical protein
MRVRSPVDVVLLGPFEAVYESGAGSCVVGPSLLPFEHEDEIRCFLAAPTGGRLYLVTRSKEVAEMEVEHDEQGIIQRVAALDIGKAEVVCCVRVPGPGRRRM